MPLAALALFIAVAALLLAVLTRVEVSKLTAGQANPTPADTSGAIAPNPHVDAIRTWLATAPTGPLTTDAILAGALPGTPSTRTQTAHVTTAMKSLGYRASRVRLPEREGLLRVWQLAPGSIRIIAP